MSRRLIFSAFLLNGLMFLLVAYLTWNARWVNAPPSVVDMSVFGLAIAGYLASACFFAWPRRFRGAPACFAVVAGFQGLVLAALLFMMSATGWRVNAGLMLFLALPVTGVVISLIAMVGLCRSIPPGVCRGCGYECSTAAAVCPECGGDPSCTPRSDPLLRLLARGVARADRCFLAATRSRIRAAAGLITTAAGLAMLLLLAADVGGRMYINERGWDYVVRYPTDEQQAWWIEHVGSLPASGWTAALVPPQHPIFHGRQGRRGAAGLSGEFRQHLLAAYPFRDTPRWFSGAAMTSISDHAWRGSVQFPRGPIATLWFTCPPGQTPPALSVRTWELTIHWWNLFVNALLLTAASVPLLAVAGFVWSRRRESWGPRVSAWNSPPAKDAGARPRTPEPVATVGPRP